MNNLRLDFYECEEKGLLRRIPPSGHDAAKSIEKAKTLIEEAGSDYKNKTYSSCLLLSYTAMFHSARALLLKDGYREKSHACIGRYLEEKYVKAGKLEQKWADLFDRFRDLRHTDLYDLEFRAGEKEAGEALVTARMFAERMKKLL